MDLITLHNLQMVMLSGMFLLGVITCLAGVAILVSGAWGRDLRAITDQTARLAQKGITEEIAGLVGNASTLLTALNEMIRTSTGIGVFLTLAGATIMAVSCWFLFQLG